MAEIVEFYIIPGERNLGLGSDVLREIVEKAREAKCLGIEVASSLLRLDAQRFYLNAGFSKSHDRFFLALDN
jgi:GNAT superfamily N-acetyltransferase